GDHRERDQAAFTRRQPVAPPDSAPDKRRDQVLRGLRGRLRGRRRGDVRVAEYLRAHQLAHLLQLLEVGFHRHTSPPDARRRGWAGSYPSTPNPVNQAHLTDKITARYNSARETAVRDE